MLIRCCLIHINIIILRHILHIAYLCTWLGLGLFLIFILIFKEFLTHQKFKSLFIPMTFNMLWKQCLVSNFQFPVSLSKTAWKNASKCPDHSGDAMHGLPNTSPNAEAAVHRYSTKKLFRKTLEKLKKHSRGGVVC